MSDSHRFSLLAGTISHQAQLSEDRQCRAVILDLGTATLVYGNAEGKISIDGGDWRWPWSFDDRPLQERLLHAEWQPSDPIPPLVLLARQADEEPPLF